MMDVEETGKPAQMRALCFIRELVRPRARDIQPARSSGDVCLRNKTMDELSTSQRRGAGKVLNIEARRNTHPSTPTEPTSSVEMLESWEAGRNRAPPREPRSNGMETGRRPRQSRLGGLPRAPCINETQRYCLTLSDRVCQGLPWPDII